MSLKKLTLCFVAIMCSTMALGCVAGCQSSGFPAPKAFPAEMGRSWDGISASVLSQTVWKEMSGNLRGHVKDPGIEGYYRQEHAVGSRLTGVDGDINLDGEGEGVGQINEAFAEKLIDLYGEDQATTILRLLREQSTLPATDPSPSPDEG